MDVTEEDLQAISSEIDVPVSDLQSEAVKDCAESVKRDNPDLSKSQAFAICQDMENQGLLAEAHIALAELQDPGAIERVEEDDGSVRYRNILLLAPGVWGDAGSGRRILYSEEGIANSADNWESNTINLFHEQENETVEVGEVDLDSLYLGEDDGALYGDPVLHLENDASRMADDLLQQALESNGRKGLQGPSVELRGEEYRFNEEHGVHELVEGTFNGLGLVGLGVSPGPGSEDAAFEEQTRERAVALADTESATLLTRQQNDVKMDREHVLEQLEEQGVTVGDDPDEDTLQTLLDAFDIDAELQDDEDDDDDEMEEEEEEGSSHEDEEDDEDVDINLEDVAERVDDIASQVAENAERIDAIAQQTEELSDQTVEIREADVSLTELAESVENAALAETVDDLESRLEALEDEPEDAQSLMDGVFDETNDESESGTPPEQWGTLPTTENAFRAR